ncbi:MAG: hypothetical protein IGS23_01915 [Rivularia sp. T60_A2020_040]|nr:hypothetical protein [Rivularia sp. T60_A2020_040]
MKLHFGDKLIRLGIYLLPFTPFAFMQAGFGIVQPALPIILLALIFFVTFKGVKLKSVLGNAKSVEAILIFFTIAIISTVLSFLANQAFSLYKSIGVLVSLGVFILIYYSISAFNINLYKSRIFFNDFLRVAFFISILVIIEFVTAKLLGKNYIYEQINEINDLLPYSTTKWVNLTSLDRYKGILLEPGDVGLFTIPAFASLISIFFRNKNSKAYHSLIIVVLTLATFLTRSVTNCFLLFLIAGFFIINQHLDFRKSKLKITAIIAFISLIFTTISVLFIAHNFQNYFHPIIQTRIKYLSDFIATQQYDNSTNLSVQVILNSLNATVYSLQKNYILGVGLGNINQSYEAVALARGINTRLNQHDAYSMLLRLLSEVGIAGTIAFLHIFWCRVFQSLKLIEYVKANFIMSIVNRDFQELYNLTLMINSAAIASCLYAFFNYPTYWNIITPLLFGLCIKENFIHSINKT